MELVGSALTALFIGLVWTLIKVVEYFLSSGGKKQVLINEQDKFNEIYIKLQQFNDLLNVINNNLKHLNEMHLVYDENRVPRWYISPEILPLVRQIHNSLEIIGKEFEDDFVIIKTGQTTIIQKILDLLSAQKLMVERLSDIIMKLNKSE